MYFDEDLVLDLRFHTLNQYVHRFIINESAYTHSGKPRKPKFDINNFSKFKDKISYNIIENLPKNIESINPQDPSEQKKNKTIINALKRENFQRNELTNNMNGVGDEDLIIISDADEIPNLSNYRYKKKFSFFVQDMFYYKFNLKYPHLKWIGSRACKKKDLISAQWLRNIKAKKFSFWRFDILFSKKKYFGIDFINNGGWHFTSIKKPEEIFFKFSNFLHHFEFQDSKISLEKVKKIIKEKKILYDYSVDQKQNKWGSKENLIRLDINKKNLPDYIVDNKNKFINWIE